MLDLYTDATPNGLKISICLEELGLKYNVHRTFLAGDQMTPEFTKLNPNNKIPVLVDDGFVLTESGAIPDLPRREDRQASAQGAEAAR